MAPVDGVGVVAEVVVGQLLQAGQALGAPTVFTAAFKKLMIIFLFIVSGLIAMQ